MKSTTKSYYFVNGVNHQRRFDVTSTGSLLCAPHERTTDCSFGPGDHHCVLFSNYKSNTPPAVGSDSRGPK